ncbi:MAG: hypothetical protein MK212_14965 [Saprospiraceae bacterium]|nr:hypothetical protein [Saprospiraceae bacterium]
MLLEEKSSRLQILEREIKRKGDWFISATETVQNEGVSNYPILIAHQNAEIGIGLVVIDSQKENLYWNYNLTTLEELATKKIIGADRIDDFRHLYKSKTDHFCVFLLEEESQFIFIPYPK